MGQDPRMADLVRAVPVHPLMIALRLFLALPDDPDEAGAALAFAKRAGEEYSKWVAQLPLADSAASRRPASLAADIIEVLGLAHTNDSSVTTLDIQSRAY